VDRDKLVKLLAMTTSSSDGEALNAMRMANSLIKAAGKTWAEVFASQTTINIHAPRSGFRAPQAYSDVEDWVPPHLQDKVVIDHMFRAVYAQPRSDNEEFWQFMDSIHNRWTKFGNLTQGQYNALKKCYNRVRVRSV